MPHREKKDCKREEKEYKREEKYCKGEEKDYRRKEKDYQTEEKDYKREEMITRERKRIIRHRHRKRILAIVGAPPKESVGAPDQMTVSQHSKSEGWHPSPLSPLPSSLYCNLCIKALYLRRKYN